MSLPRFHLAAAAWVSPQLTLEQDEAAHCARVMRKQPGDAIEIFDGEGRVAVCEITKVSKHAVQACVTSEIRVAPLATAIHLFPALIKAEPFEWLLEKAVELGAASVQPLITERTIIHLSGSQLEKKLSKWRRHMIESAKQCHTSIVPRLEAPRIFHGFISEIDAALKLIPAISERFVTLKQIVPPSPPTSVAVLIGPEGDFTSNEEAEANQAGFVRVTLGPLVLRAETATISTLAVLGHEFFSAH
ncbi:MAG: 16S rRNA (uracil(1498)-N(3))-methyltransferase [Prosthecobacter sp.]